MPALSKFPRHKNPICSTDSLISVYTSEIFPTWMRAQGVGFSLIGLFGSTLVYTQAATTAFANIGWRYYIGT